MENNYRGSYNNISYNNNNNNYNVGQRVSSAGLKNEIQIAAYLKREYGGEFLNKKFLLTGASSGVGNSLAYFLLNNGAKVLLCGRDIDRLKKIGEKFPNQASACEIDLTIDLQVFDLKTSAIEVLGGIDCIINCAGIMFDGDLEKTFPQDYDYTIDVNLRSLFLLLKCLDKFILTGCSIINISCIYGNRPFPGMLSHNVSKKALELFTKFAALEFSSRGVRVNAISAGLIDSNALRYSGISENAYEKFKSRAEKNIPLGRMSTPDDIAKAVLFLMSKRSSKITGQVIKVDGGRSLTSSGFIPWKGSKNMNSRFEPDGYDLKTNLKNTIGKVLNNENNLKYPSTPEEIDKLINESNWATRLTEAHIKLSVDYKALDQNDAFLKKNYMK
jgi:NAD(P)-dependent dehydrogenase (short-subunit alcohol dehydrogenase family)